MQPSLLAQKVAMQHSQDGPPTLPPDMHARGRSLVSCFSTIETTQIGFLNSFQYILDVFQASPIIFGLFSIFFDFPVLLNQKN
jgi:hypothetical protein